MVEENISKRSRLFSDTFMLFFLPIYGFILLNSYEFGYFKRLNIPTDFIEVNLSALAKISGLLFIYFLIIYGWLEFLYSTKIHKSATGIRILYYLSFMVITSLPLYAFTLLKIWLPVIIFSLSILFFSEFIFPLFYYKNIKGYKNKLNQWGLDRKKEAGDSLGTLVSKKFGHDIILYIFILLSFTYVAFSMGAIKAKTQKTFLIIKSNPELVVLRKYSQTFICSEFDREKKEIMNKYYIWSTSQIAEQKCQISSEDIGPLIATKKSENKELDKNNDENY